MEDRKKTAQGSANGQDQAEEQPEIIIADALEEPEFESKANNLGSEQIDTLQAALDEQTAKVDEYLNGWQRARAEFANYKKRIEREQAQIHQTTTGNIAKHFLGVADDLDRALKNQPQEGDGAAWANGIELIYRKLLTTLENEGITPMDTEGQFFDPNLHEAITSEPNDEFESGQIIEVLQPGFLQGERVLRPAVVRVAQ